MTAPLKLGAHFCGGTTQFCVWAPNAESLRLERGDSDDLIAMERSSDGYFTTEAEAHPGTLYQFVFPDGTRRPDPASRAQPQGVHGPSMVASWTRPSLLSVLPLEQHVIYELHVGAFTPQGSFAAIVNRLSALRALGITAIELMPIAQFPGDRNWGYDGVGLFAAQWSYGGLAGLLELVNACHANDLAVILDVVYNHVGPEGNYLQEFGPYFSDAYKTPWGNAVNLDGAESDHVREFFIQNALHWVIDCGIDGLRLDAVHALHDRTARPFLAELAQRVHEAAEQQGRRALLIAESSDNDPRLVRPQAVGGFALDGSWNDDYHHAVRTALTGDRHGYYRSFGRVSQIAKAIKDRYVFAGEYSSNHRRRHGAPARDIPHGRLITFTQNHDHVGNRPLGERLDAVVGADGARAAAALVLLAPFTPLLWMGEEYAEPAPFMYFTSHSDGELIEAVRRGRRLEFAESFAGVEAPDPQDVQTFIRSKLHWELRDREEHRAQLDYYTTLLRLRREHVLVNLTHPPIGLAWDDSQIVAIVYRNCVVAANLGQEEHEVDIPARIPGDARVVLNSQDRRWNGTEAPARIVTTSRSIQVQLPGRSAIMILPPQGATQ